MIRPTRIAPAALLAALSFMGMADSVAQKIPPADPSTYVAPPYVIAQQLFFDDKLSELDPLITSLIDKDARDEDGLPSLMLVTEYLGYAAAPPSGGDLEVGKQRIQAWMKAVPDSPFAPIVEAERLRQVAWRARGRGYAADVTPEGWEIFHEQNQAAWKVLMDARKKSSHIPSWYSLAILSGRNGEVPETEISAIFEEGRKRFPTYYEIYFTYLQGLAPRWGGDYDAARAFIREQTDTPANKDGDMLYTRLYWALDSAQGSPVDFFEKAQPDWTRMRRGFDSLLSQYPGSARNLTQFGVFACRARDRATYEKLRPKLTSDNFREFVRPAYTLEVCDRRFAPTGN